MARSTFGQRVIAIVCVASLSVGALSQDFPRATPESQGLDPAQVKRLSDTLQRYFDDGSIVGAEILIVKNRKTVFEAAYGWRDREDEEKMEVGSIFNIRSMTKPMTGAALQMLIEEGKVGIDDKVSEHLEEFDTDNTREITVRQLLTHRAGVPLTAMTSIDQFENLSQIAKAMGEAEMVYEPDEQFFYSDGGTDCVAALVERVSGRKVDEFIAERLFAPLGMNESFHVWSDDLSDRLVSLYGGGRGRWIRIWDADKALYPFAWGSQTVYSTTQDYAKFLAMWMDGGMAGDTRILSEETLARGLSPVSEMAAMGTTARMPTGFFQLGTYYGEMAQLWFEQPLEEGASPVVFGHSGSDGTIAWAWPEEDLMVLVFTQSRGGGGLLRVETIIDATIRNMDTEVAPLYHLPKLGTYLANFSTFQNEEWQIMFVNGQLAIEIPSQFIARLVDPDEDRLWTIVGGSSKLSFADAVDGECPTIYLHAGSQKIELPRGTAPEQRIEPVKLEDVEKLLGKYRVPEDGSEVEILLEDGALILYVESAEIKVPLVPVKDRPLVWLVNGQLPLQFVEEDGEIVMFKTVLPDGTALERPKIKGARQKQLIPR